MLVTMFSILITTLLLFTFSVGTEKDLSEVRSLTDNELRMAEQVGFSYVDRLTQVEEELFAQGIYVKEGSHMSRMAKFKQPSQEVINLSRKSMRFTETVRFLKNELGMTDQEIEHNSMRFTNEAQTGCLNPPTCPKTSNKYRTVDGSCNSNNSTLLNLGRSASGYRRLLKPTYDDGISNPRTLAKDGTALPYSRNISVIVFDDQDVPLPNTTNLMMQFGQFINHDMESTTQFTFANGTAYTCCAADNYPLSPSILKNLDYCFPIYILPGDNELNATAERCMTFSRSNTGPNRISCNLPFVSYAEQVNQNTHWLDASTVYGSDSATMDSLRDTACTGMLATSVDKYGRYLLPVTSGCTTGACFYAGDSRVTEHPQLTVMHTIWLREHNRIALKLSNLNPCWNSETIFQETRRIVIAELQHITYNEFLPNLLGNTAMTKYNLTPLPGGNTFSGYTTDGLTSGPISNEFATAAFRMGHSLVQGLVQMYDVNDVMTTYQMDHYFNNPSSPNNQAVIYNNKTFIDNVIRGLVKQPSQTADIDVVDDLWLTLFQNLSNTGPPFDAFDLVALNIQRGRDHGLPGYNSYRKYCGLPALSDPISSLPTLNSSSSSSANAKGVPLTYFDPSVVETLAQVYHNVDDIDLYVGGLAELSTLGDGIVGPTMTCLLAENFNKLKYGDRFFYESAANPNPFSSTLLAEIKKASMARILCDNSDGSIATMQPKVFLMADSKTNPLVSCKNTNAIPSLNLNYWSNLRT